MTAILKSNNIILHVYVDRVGGEGFGWSVVNEKNVLCNNKVYKHFEACTIWSFCVLTIIV